MSENKGPGGGQSMDNGLQSGPERVESGVGTDDAVAFEWMRPAANPAVPTEASAPPESAPQESAAGPAPTESAADGSSEDDGESAPAGRHWPTAAVKAEPRPAWKGGPMRTAGKLPDLSAYEAAPGTRESSSVFNEPLPTSMLQVRPPQEEVDRRAAEREEAANAKPVLPRVMQVLLAVFYPVVLLVLSIRLITTPLFLWAEYNRPGFPPDNFGFSTDDRMTFGSYTVDYLLNFAGPRYLGGLVNADGRPLFNTGEVSHMADVKSVITMAFIAGTVLAIGMIIAIVYLSRRSHGGVRRGLFAGSVATLVLVITLGVLGFMGWETFFTDFHEIFFKNGTWTFYLNDTLIRLFPGQFWQDAGLVIGLAVFVVSTLTLAFSWPTRTRREASARAKNPAQGRRAAAGA
ncbi:MAG: TIGR01906 family membrane protein [Actinomycetota bacterium]|nr:TIGR01906 family membrane protein [Actinomycetota bacterium]